MMEVIANSIFVNNQDQALKFYTNTLGFKLKHDIPVGGGFRWLAVTSESNPNGAELILEPNDNPIAKDYQQRLKEAGIPITMFGVENVKETYQQLYEQGIHFHTSPTKMGGIAMAIFDDTCGNLIQIIEQ